MIGATSALALIGALQLLPPQTTALDSTLEAFLEAARAATARYHDVEVARVHGYRLVGPDFPGMGEHWVNVSLLLDGRFDITAPAILSYAPTAAGRRLVGVVYAVPLQRGERPPELPIPARYWHEHSGSIDDESLVLHHIGRDRSGASDGGADRGTPGGSGGEGPNHEHPHSHLHGVRRSGAGSSGIRLAVVHAWIWLDNPAGIFATDNWALPWFRAGLDPAPDGPVQAAKMLAFATGADAYYLAAARALARPTESEAEALAAVFADHGRRIRQLAESWPAEPDSTGGRDRAAALLEAWHSMWAEVEGVVTPESYRRLAPLRATELSHCIGKIPRLIAAEMSHYGRRGHSHRSRRAGRGRRLRRGQYHLHR